MFKVIERHKECADASAEPLTWVATSDLNQAVECDTCGQTITAVVYIYRGGKA